MQRDTDRPARDAQLAALGRLDPSEKLRLAVEMSEDARRIAIEGERRRHPALTEEQARTMVLRRLWGPDLAARVRDAPRGR